MNNLYKMTKYEAEARLNRLFEMLERYSISQAISDEIDRTMEYLNELED